MTAANESDPARPDPARRWAQVCDVLDAVLDAPAEQRAALLEQRCAGDPSLREEVEGLLRAEHAFDERLESPLVERAGALVESDGSAPPPDRSPGDAIGPWRLVRELGRGGMGAVWLAERADGAFEQQVALKLLKRGLDSDAILERFLAERQILARLQHPHIAHLVDGGLTPDGRPYFAMELVEGEPITRWCDQRRLPVRDRVQLFLAVVDAVQHAHRQLVVHRDLKPSNILVTPQGEAKLLDFGIAKLLDADAARAEAQTLTQLGIRMLTPEYAAPEQIRGDAVTTSTDVYALGVLLHELLAGKRPPPAASDGKLPPRPSMQIDATAAQARSTTPERLRRALRGDLDTIVLRALHPEPERRYPTADALGADLRRHRDREPVLARPDSLRYRAGRFIARNRLAVAAAALVALTLVGGIMATTWQAQQARQQARRAKEVKDFLITVFEAGSPQEWRGKEPTARELLDAGARRADEELSDDPALHAEMLATIGSLYSDLGQPERAEPLLQRSLGQRERMYGKDHPAYADSLHRWSQMLYEKGDWQGAATAQTAAIDIFRRSPGEQVQLAAALRSLSLTKLMLGDAAASADLQRQALRLHRRTHGNAHPSVADDLRLLGGLLVDQARYAEAAPLYDEAIRIYKDSYGADSVRYAQALNAQAMMLQKQGRLGQAAKDFQTAAMIYRRADDQINLEDALNHQGDVLCKLGKFGQGLQNLRDALEIAQKTRRSSSRIGIRAVSLGECLARIGSLSEAEAQMRRGLELITSEVGNTHGWTPFAMARLAAVLAERGRTEEAQSLSAEAVALFRTIFGADSTWVSDGLRIRSGVLLAAGDRSGSIDAARRCVQILVSADATGDRQYGLALLQLAEAELQGGRYQQAQARFQQAFTALEGSGDHPEAATATLLRGMALALLDRMDEAEPLLRKALREHYRLYGTTSGRAGEAELIMGRALERHGRTDEGGRLVASGRDKVAREFGEGYEIFGEDHHWQPQAVRRPAPNTSR